MYYWPPHVRATNLIQYMGFRGWDLKRFTSHTVGNRAWPLGQALGRFDFPKPPPSGSWYVPEVSPGIPPLCFVQTGDRPCY
jgi:hypothetical protein